MRPHIGIFGRTNVGKSSFFNLVTSQDAAIVSPLPGTTTDTVEKAVEFHPVGPVVFIDTAGVDDVSPLSGDRIGRTRAVFGRADVFVVVTESGEWGEFEDDLCAAARARNAPIIIVVNKTDINAFTDEFRRRLEPITPYIMGCSFNAHTVNTFRDILIKCLPDDDLDPQTLSRCGDGQTGETLSRRGDGRQIAAPTTITGGLIPAGGVAILVAPIDTGAPKGRLIMPQVQTIRDILDGDASAIVTKDCGYQRTLSMLGGKPDIVICDSQVVREVIAQTPVDIPVTTFSILFARLKGDLAEAARGAAAIGGLKDGDKVLIAEACAHHAAGDDIGRVKIPRMLKERTGADLQIDIYSGRDYPQNLEQYSLIIHCGACMFTRREMLSRVSEAVEKNVPITNYGLAISYLQGVLGRVVEPYGLK